MREMRHGGWCGVRRGRGTLFYGSEGGGASGCLQWLAMKEAFNAADYWVNEEGVCHLMGEWRRR
jgi:hypothetical protein